MVMEEDGKKERNTRLTLHPGTNEDIVHTGTFQRQRPVSIASESRTLTAPNFEKKLKMKEMSYIICT